MGKIIIIFFIFIFLFAFGIIVRTFFLFGSFKFVGSTNLSVIISIFVKNLSSIVNIGRKNNKA